MAKELTLGKNRETMRTMFPEKSLQLPPEISQLLSSFMLMLSTAKNKTTNLFSGDLARVGQYGEAFLEQSAQAEEVISGFETSAQDTLAAEKLVNLFGVPQSPLAVPVFKSLVENLSFAQEFSRFKAREVKAALKKTQALLRIVGALVFDNQIENLKKEEDQYKEAEPKLAAIQTGENLGIKNIITKGTRLMKTKTAATTRKKNFLEQQRRRWGEFVESLTGGSEEVIVFSQQNFEIDPSMALPL